MMVMIYVMTCGAADRKQPLFSMTGHSSVLTRPLMTVTLSHNTAVSPRLIYMHPGRADDTGVTENMWSCQHAGAPPAADPG